MTRTLQSILESDAPRPTIPPYWRHEHAVTRGAHGGRVAQAKRARKNWNQNESKKAWWNT